MTQIQVLWRQCCREDKRKYLIVTVHKLHGLHEWEEARAVHSTQIIRKKTSKRQQQVKSEEENGEMRKTEHAP